MSARTIRATCAAALAVVLAAAVAADVLAQGAAPASTDAALATAPVTLDGVELFRVRGVSSYPAETRAQAIGERIAAAAADRSIALDSLRTVRSTTRPASTPGISC